MEINIVIGLLTGAVIGTTFYVYNSPIFTKQQKIIIFICIIFPPLHWLLIGVFAFYNKKKRAYQNTGISQKEVEKHQVKVNSAMSNLSDLKNAGILNAGEYNQKVEQLEVENSQMQLLKSPQYIQLQSLHKQGILSDVELQDKIEKLKSIERENLSNIALLEQNIIGSYDVGSSIISFFEDYKYEISMGQSKTIGTWKLLNISTLSLFSANYSTTFDDFKLLNERISYKNGKTIFEGIKMR